MLRNQLKTRPKPSDSRTLDREHNCVAMRQEGNDSARDLSSTEPYQRDSFPQFLFYWARHSFGSWVELPLYALKRRRYRCTPSGLLMVALLTADM